MIAVSEVFGPTIQGEGPVIGEPTVFVRTGGCDYRCVWCDSLHAVLPEHRGEWEQLDAMAVFARVQRLSPEPIMVTLSGGNPAMQPLGALLDLGHEHDYRFCIETQGSLAPVWLKDVDVVVLSPKPPSSRMEPRWDRFEKCLASALQGAAQVALKVPIFDTLDLDWAQKEVGERYPYLPLYLSVGNPNPPADPAAGGEMAQGRLDEPATGMLLALYEDLCSEVLRRGMRARVLPQLHVLVWGNQRGR